MSAYANTDRAIESQARDERDHMPADWVEYEIWLNECERRTPCLPCEPITAEELPF